MNAVAVTGVGLVCALGDAPREVAARLRAGESGLRRHPPLDPLPDSRAGVVEGPDLRPWLKRRKDARLMARPSVLALAAMGAALGDWPGDRAELGLYLGVGREPPDQGDSEPCLLAADNGGSVDEALLAGPGRDLYPPLLPLQTLPNMALAHVSINLGICGENGAWAGETEASWMALEAAWWTVAEGRAPAALAGGTDSAVDLGSARDRLRLGARSAPGEAAAALLLEPLAAARARGARIHAVLARPGPWAGGDAWQALLRQAVGDTGAAEGALALALAISGAAPGMEAPGGGAASVSPRGFLWFQGDGEGDGSHPWRSARGTLVPPVPVQDAAGRPTTRGPSDG